VNNRVVTAERNKLGEDTISGIRAVKDMVKFSDPQQQKPENVSINNKILSAARSANILKENSRRIKKKKKRERKAKEAERAEAARKKQEVESMRAKKQTLLAKETS